VGKKGKGRGIGGGGRGGGVGEGDRGGREERRGERLQTTWEGPLEILNPLFVTTVTQTVSVRIRRGRHPKTSERERKTLVSKPRDGVWGVYVGGQGSTVTMQADDG